MAWSNCFMKDARRRGWSLLFGLALLDVCVAVGQPLLRQDKQDVIVSAVGAVSVLARSEPADYNDNGQSHHRLVHESEQHRDQHVQYASAHVPQSLSMVAQRSVHRQALMQAGVAADEPDFETMVGCYDSKKEKIPDCECHPSCRACGYNDMPFGASNCLRCPDGSRPLEKLWKDGGGSCAPVLLSGGCFGRGFQLPESACTCHPTCKACGFSLRPWGPNDCISCATGDAVRQVFLEGTGTCPSRHQEGHCYDLDKKPIEGCTCHESCLDCGYDLSPELPHQCLSCKHGTPVRILKPDGTGTCPPARVADLPFYGPSPLSWGKVRQEEEGEKRPGCYSREGSRIIGCECHATCMTCGYGYKPTRTTDCLSCRDGNEVQILAGDGSGWCKKPRLEGCYGKDMNPIEGCTCHPSCKACGYSDRPVLETDCIECRDDRKLHNCSAISGSGVCLEPLREGCYNSDLERIPGCVCHDTCEACGYEDDPTGPSHCITCRNGEAVKESPFRLDGTGSCGREHKGCYNLQNSEVRNCTCHESCLACGYRDSPTEASDCIRCKSGVPVRVVHHRTGEHNGWPFLNSGYCEKPTEPGCYDDEAKPIQMCVCHPSCLACGFGVDPIDKSRCISCVDSEHPLAVRADGTGYCGKWKDWHRQQVSRATVRSSAKEWLSAMKQRAAQRRKDNGSNESEPTNTTESANSDVGAEAITAMQSTTENHTQKEAENVTELSNATTTTPAMLNATEPHNATGLSRNETNATDIAVGIDTKGS